MPWIPPSKMPGEADTIKGTVKLHNYNNYYTDHLLDHQKNNFKI